MVRSARCRSLKDLGTKCCEGINCLITKDYEQDLSLETNRKGKSNIFRHVHNHPHMDQSRIYKSNWQSHSLIHSTNHY